MLNEPQNISPFGTIMIASKAIPLMINEMLVHNLLPSCVSKETCTSSNAGISSAPDIIVLQYIFPPRFGK